MREGAVGPCGGNDAGAELRSQDRRLRVASLLARDVMNDASGRFRRRGKGNPGAIQNVALRCGDLRGADVFEARLAGELREYRRCFHGCFSFRA